MKWFVYDFEVFQNDWLVVFKEVGVEDGWTVFHNDNDGFWNFISSDCVYIGFNSKAYDQFIAKGILLNMDPQEIKQINDFLIDGGNGWEYPPIADGGYIGFNNADIMDDMQMGLSLKAIECHLGMSIVESSVPFDIKRPLTPQEIEETIFYCKHDVETTERVVQLRRDYLQTKIDIGAMVGIPEHKALAMTNAKLTAALLHAKPMIHTDERQYQYPGNLLREYIPAQVFEFFDRMKDERLTDEQVFKSKMKLKIGDCEVTLGYGGIHAGIPNYIWKENNGEREDNTGESV